MGFFDLFKSNRVSKTPPPLSQMSSEKQTPVNRDFLLTVKDILSIPSHGSVVTGLIEKGSVCKNDFVLVHGPLGKLTLQVSDLEIMGSKEEAVAGNSVGLLFRGEGSEKLRNSGITHVSSLEQEIKDIF